MGQLLLGLLVDWKQQTLARIDRFLRPQPCPSASSSLLGGLSPQPAGSDALAPAPSDLATPTSIL